MRKILTVIGFLLLSFSIAACTGATSITFIFETNGGNAIENMIVDTQDTSFELPTPVKEGFTFDGWYINEELTDPFNFATLLTSTEITVYAKWSSGSVDYTITFETNGGSAVAAITLASGATVTAPANPTKTGFTFGGWYSDALLTTAYTFSVMPAENITLYAKWTAVVVQTTISFEVNGGSAVAAITQNVGSTVTAPANPTKTGFTFGGWYSDALLTTAYTFTVMPDENITLYAKWTAIVVQTTITFEVNGGSAVTAITQNVGSAVTAPANPTKAGYTFGGWYSDTLLTTAYTFSVMPSTNLTLYAKWNINQYTISFEENGGSAVTDITQAYLSTVVAPVAPTKEGYTFGGWYSDILLTTAYTFTTMPANNITLYAKWTPIQYTIEFEENGGSAVLNIVRDYGAAIVAPADPVRPGYTFAGWYRESELIAVFPFTTMPLGGTVVYAKWTINQYTLSFEENGGSIVGDLTLDYMSEITLPTDPTRTGYEFTGWYSDALLSTLYVFSTMPAENVTVYAGWESVTYYIDFFDFINGANAAGRIEGIAGQALILPTPDPVEGYTFIGWFTDIQFTELFVSVVMPDHDLTLYGQWEPIVYTITFNTNDGSSISDMHVPYSNQMPYPEIPTKEGYLFAGWFTDEGLLLEYNFNTMVTSDLTLYAKWIEDEGYDLISLVLINQPQEDVTLRGVIYYKFPDPMNPGFYLYDGTGYIFVLSHANGFNVGDGVEVVGQFDLFENTPQIINVSSINPDGTFVTMPEASVMSLEDLTQTSEYDINIYGQPITITGVVGQQGPYFYLSVLGSDSVFINYKSYVPMSNPFPALVGQTVTINAVIYDFNSNAYEWHILYNSAYPVAATPMTDQEKLDELILFAQTMLDYQVFYNGQTFMIPESEPVYGALLSAETFGVNASYYDPISGQFGLATEETEIGLRINVTVGALSGSVDLTLVLMPVESVSIAEFILADEMSYYLVSGVVIFAATQNEMQLMVIADSTGTLGVISNSEVAVGDFVVVNGYRMSQDGMAMMANEDPSMTLLGITGHDYEIPIDPISITVPQFAGLNPNNNLYWLQYFEITGKLEYSESTHWYVLRDGDYEVPIFAFDFNAYEFISNYEGFNVTIRGISFPNFDHEGMFLTLFVARPEDMSLDYTDEELLTEVQSMLTLHFEDTTYYPGQIVELPTRHPAVPLDISYEAFGANASLIDLLSGEISPTIETELWIDLHVTITYGLLTEVFDVQLHVVPIVILSVSDFYELTDYDHPYFVTGIVIFVQPDHFMVMIADSTHVIMVQTNDILEIGDLVVAYGYKMHQDSMVMVVGDKEPTIVDIQLHNQPNPMMKTIITIDDFLALDMTLPENVMRYYQIQGTLLENPEFHLFFLSDGMNNIPIFPSTMDAYAALAPYADMEVLVSGFSFPNPENPTEEGMLIYINYPGDIMTNMTPEQFAVYYAGITTTLHDQNVYRPGAEHFLRESFPEYNLRIHYETSGPNASFYDVGVWLIASNIFEDIFIDITADIYIDEIFYMTFSFQIHVAPEPVLSVTQFAELEDYENQYLVEGTVIFVQDKDGLFLLADGQTIILALSVDMVEVGDYVQMHGYKMNSGGLVMLGGDPVQTLVEIILHDQEMPMYPMTISYEDFLALNPYDPSNSMKYYEFIGTITEDTMSHMLFINSESYSIPVITSTFEDYMILASYVGVEVKLKAISTNSGDAGQMMLSFINYPGDIGLPYTLEEYVDHLVLTLPDKYALKYFIPGQTYLFPESDPNYAVNFSYLLTGPNAGDYDLSTGLISGSIASEEDIEVTITITAGAYSQDVVVSLHVIPPVLVTIDDFIIGMPDVLYQVQGIVLMYMFDDKDGVLIISDGVSQLLVLTPLGVNPGDEIIIVGFQNDFEGLMVIGADGLAQLVEVVSTGNALPVTPEVMTISDFNMIDMTDTSNWGIYVEITGFITTYYDEYENRMYIYLDETFNGGEYFELMFQDDESIDLLSMYEGLEVVIKGFALPYFDNDIALAYPVFYYEDYANGIVTTYVTDQEKIDALILLGSRFLEGQIFTPDDTLNLPDEFPILDATLSWAITSGPSEIYDFLTGAFTNVTEESTLIFEATITVGSTTVAHEFTVIVEPLPVLTVAEFISSWQSGNFTIQGVIIEVISPDLAILQDHTGMLLVEGYSNLFVGYEVSIIGERLDYSGVVRMSGYDGGSYYVINEGVTPFVPMSDMSLAELATYNNQFSGLETQYISLSGRLLFSSEESSFTITDGVFVVYVTTFDPVAMSLLEGFSGSDVTINVFTFEEINTSFGLAWSVYFMGNPGEISAFVPTEEQVVDYLIALADERLSDLYYPNASYVLPLTHPLYGGTLSYELTGPNSIYAFILDDEIHFYDPDYTILIDVSVTASYGAVTVIVPVQIALQIGENPMGIAAGSLGAVPVSLESTANPSQFSGVYVEQVSRHNDFFGGTELVADIWFPLPSEVGADYYILQYYDDILGWTNFDYGEYTPLTTTNDNFSLTLGLSYTFRLITSGVVGGELVSNSVEVPYTLIDTVFTGWSLDMAMWLTGTMYPYVGCGMEAAATVSDMNYDNLDVTLLYQWYRVNPFTFEEELIPGATNQLYVTTFADVGYLIKAKISGDEVTAGGFTQVFGFDTIQVFNPGFVSDITPTGFTLNLGFSADIADIENHLFIYDQFGADLAFTAVTPTINPAIFIITADLSGVTQFDLQLYANTWSLGSMDMWGYHMPGIYVVL